MTCRVAWAAASFCLATPTSTLQTVVTMTPREQAIRSIASRQVSALDSSELVPTSDYFGVNTFSVREMRGKLPAEIFAKLLDAVRLGRSSTPRSRRSWHRQSRNGPSLAERRTFVTGSSP